MYILICIYIYTYIYIYYIDMYIYIHIYIYIYIYIHIYIYICVCVSTCVYIYICMYVCIYICVNIHIYIYIYTYTHKEYQKINHLQISAAICRIASWITEASEMCRTWAPTSPEVSGHSEASPWFPGIHVSWYQILVNHQRVQKCCGYPQPLVSPHDIDQVDWGLGWIWGSQKFGSPQNPLEEMAFFNLPHTSAHWFAQRLWQAPVSGHRPVSPGKRAGKHDLFSHVGWSSIHFHRDFNTNFLMTIFWYPFFQDSNRGMDDFVQYTILWPWHTCVAAASYLHWGSVLQIKRCWGKKRLRKSLRTEIKDL